MKNEKKGTNVIILKWQKQNGTTVWLIIIC